MEGRRTLKEQGVMLATSNNGKEVGGPGYWRSDTCTTGVNAREGKG